MKKVLSVILSLVMLLCVLPVSSIAAKDYTPATEYASYDANKVAANDSEYIGGLSVDQIAGILLDYVDGILAGVDVDVNYEGFEINTLDMLDVDTLTKWAYDAISGDMLGGDFDKLDASALAGLSRKNGDVNYMLGMLQFMADNADLFGKVFSWDNKEETFDCGKIGEYLETLNEGDEGYEARVFYEKYILSNNIQKAFVDEIAREMNYTIPEGETFDETISNGILAWLSGLLSKAGLLSEEGVAALKAYDLRTEDIYFHLKNLVALLQSDNEAVEKTYFTYYLDSLLRTVLKTALGFKPTVSEDDASAAVVAEFKATYADLATLYTISNGTVNFRAADGSYYQFVVTADGAIASAKALTWENALGFNLEMPVVDIFTGDNDKLVQEYKPTSTNQDDYKPTIYTKTEYVSLIPEEMKSLANVSGNAVSEEFANIIANGTAIPMKDYMKVLVKQGDEEKLNMNISFNDIKAFAEEAATKAAQSAIDSMGVGSVVQVSSVDITLNYTGYATEDEFICVVKAEAKVNLTGAAASFAQSAADSTVNNMLKDPIATVVMDNLSGSDTDISALVALKDFIDTDFAVDMGVLDFAGNYDAYNGVIGQVNRVLCDLLKMLLSDEGYKSLGLTEGGNQNLTANLQKLCDKAGKIVDAAKNVISGDDFKALADSLNVSDLFASSHGFNADMLYNLDFSSVENLYVCAIRMGCDFLDTEEPGVLHDVHMLVENSTTLDDMAVKVTDYVLAKAVEEANANIEGFSYTYSSYDGADVNDAATAKNVIMGKLVDIAYYAVNDYGFPKANEIINKCIDKLNAKLDENEAIIPHVDFKFGVAKTADWESTLNAMVDRVLDLTDGIIVCVSSIDRNANVFDKIGTVANAILPLGSLLSNCAGNGFVVDFRNIIDNIVFGEVLAGDFDNFLRLFETDVKTDDVAKGASVTYALVKASDHIVDSVFPNTVEAELYTPSLTVQQEFTSSLSDQGIAARNMRSINSVKADLVPAVLNLVRESGILPSLVKSDCGHTNTVAIAAIPATCITTGYTEGTRCKDCGKWISGHEEVAKDATVHAGPVVDVEAVEATCTTAGTAAGTKCSACGAVISGCETVDALGHDVNVVVKTVNATCTEKGYTVYKCSRCDVTENRDYTDALGHDVTVKVKTVAPTCTEEGYTVYKCSRCDVTEKKDIVLALGHTPVAVSGKAPTCTETGLTDGVKCSVCGNVITAQETIPATGHTDADGDNACDVCGATIKKPSFIDKLKAFFQKIINWFKNLFK